MMNMELSCCACGSRRSSAAAAVLNSLGAVDLVAAVVPGEHLETVALSLRDALESEPGIELLRAQPAPEGWQLRPEASEGRRVLLWEAVDHLICEDPRRFERAVRELCQLLGDEAAVPVLHRAILVGGCALMDRLAHLLEVSGPEIRFRYILVE